MLLAKNDTIEVTLPKEAHGWKLIFKFIDDDAIEERTASDLIEDNTITYSLNKWYDAAWVENMEPWRLANKNNSTVLYVKFRTQATKIGDIRQVSISVWKQM